MEKYVQRAINGVTFDIPASWWRTAGMHAFTPTTTTYAFLKSANDTVTLIQISSVAPPHRAAGEAWFERDCPVGRI